MIEFGLFSSQLPYIIFIAVYMLYFGASSLFRHDTQKPGPQSEFTERRLTMNSGYDDKTLICKITSTDNFVAQKYKNRLADVPGNFPLNISYPRDHIQRLPLFIGSPVFSRPPPFISWI